MNWYVSISMYLSLFMPVLQLQDWGLCVLLSIISWQLPEHQLVPPNKFSFRPNPLNTRNSKSLHIGTLIRIDVSFYQRYHRNLFRTQRFFGKYSLLGQFHQKIKSPYICAVFLTEQANQRALCLAVLSCDLGTTNQNACSIGSLRWNISLDLYFAKKPDVCSRGLTLYLVFNYTGLLRKPSVFGIRGTPRTPQRFYSNFAWGIGGSPWYQKPKVSGANEVIIRIEKVK